MTLLSIQLRKNVLEVFESHGRGDDSAGASDDTMPPYTADKALNKTHMGPAEQYISPIAAFSALGCSVHCTSMIGLPRLAQKSAFLEAVEPYLSVQVAQNLIDIHNDTKPRI